jgi:hypothetical protein
LYEFFFRNKRGIELEEQGFLTKATFDRLRDERQSTPNRASERLAQETEEVDGFESKTLDEEAMNSQTSSYSKMLSVSSLLAMKRDKIEKQRRATITSATAFAQNSKNDSMVNSMRTLTTIQTRRNSSMYNTKLPPIVGSNSKDE